MVQTQRVGHIVGVLELAFFFFKGLSFLVKKKSSNPYKNMVIYYNISNLKEYVLKLDTYQ